LGPIQLAAKKSIRSQAIGCLEAPSFRILINPRSSDAYFDQYLNDSIFVINK
jgi:hypothetical protein